MKNSTKSILLIITITIILLGCNKCDEGEIYNQEITALNESQIEALVKNAINIENIGDPIVRSFKTKDSVDGATTTHIITSQNYKFQILVDKNNTLINTKTGTSERRIREGVGLTTCTSSCKEIIIGQGCTNSGCTVSGTSCTSSNCGSGCSGSCTKSSSGLIFGTFSIEALNNLLSVE